jgi:hypothetical protein
MNDADIAFTWGTSGAAWVCMPGQTQVGLTMPTPKPTQQAAQALHLSATGFLLTT